MSKQCLVTTLKASADNPNLPKFGELVLPVKAVEGVALTSTNVRFGFRIIAPVTISVDGSGYFADSYAGLNDPATRLTEKEYSPAAGYTFIFLKNDNYNLRFSNKYAIEMLYSYATGTGVPANKTLVELSMDNLQFLTALKQLEINFSAERALGDIKYMATNSLLDVFTIAGDVGIYGDIKDIASSLAFKTIMLYGSNVSGSVEDLVSGQVAQGITSPDAPVSARGLLRNLTFGGTLQAATTSVACLTWNGTSKIFFGEGSSSSIDACSVIYAKGATAGEISAWEGAGKTVVVIS